MVHVSASTGRWRAGRSGRQSLNGGRAPWTPFKASSGDDRRSPYWTAVCRLFGMSGGRRPLKATFWLLEAPDSLAQQSRRNPDGYGIATFEQDGSARVDKRPAAAYEDEQFAREAPDEEAPPFLAHARDPARCHRAPP